MTMKTVLLYALGMALVAVVLMLPAAVASADSCSGNCVGPNCFGGCTISSRTCSVGCFQGNCVGTAAQCFEFGGSDCTKSLTATCAKILPDVEPGEVEPGVVTGNFEVRNTEWSVVAYDTDGRLPADENGFEVLAASSRADAAKNVDRLRGLRQDGAVRSPAALRLGVALDRGAQPERGLAYHVAPATECVRATLELSAPSFDLTVPQGASVFLRATVGADGGVSAVEILHADRTGGAEAAMVGHLKEFGHLSRADGERLPFEAYVVLSATHGGEASWIVAGSKLLL